MAVVQIDGRVTTDVLKPKSYFSVWVKPTWDSTWLYVPYLFPKDATESASPSISHAQFKWDYGAILQHDAAAYGVYTPLQIEDWYIAVWAHTYWGDWPVWIGVIENDELDNPNVNARLGVGSGNQTLGAYGLELLLKRRRIKGAFVEGGSTEIHRTIVFNRPHERGLQTAGNRSSSTNADGVYTFSTAEFEWSNLDIANYLLNYYQPSSVQFILTGEVSALDRIVETWDFQGQSVYDALNRLIDRKRGLGWRILSNGEGVVQIFVFSVLQYPIRFQDHFIPANPYQDVIVADDLLDVHPKITISRAHAVDRVIVEGGPVSCVFSMGIEKGSLEIGWHTDESTAYNAADDEERATAKYDRVYTFFRVPRDFAWSILSFEDNSAQIVCPFVRFDGTPIAVVGPYWNQDHRFQNYIPFRVQTDAANAEREYRRPFAIIENPDAPGEYVYVDKLRNVDLSDHSVRPAHRELGWEIKGPANHSIALNHFAGDSDVDAEVDYDTMIVTGFVETDSRLRVALIIPANFGSELGKDIYIEIPDAEYWFAAGGTVKDVTDGAIVYWGDEGENLTIRNDATRVRAVAVAAAAWYAQQRNIIEYTYDDVAPFHPVGMLIVAASTGAYQFASIGTVVTERKWDFMRRRTSIKTGFVELDAGMFGPRAVA